jgi:hypothetical protein
MANVADLIGALVPAFVLTGISLFVINKMSSLKTMGIDVKWLLSNGISLTAASFLAYQGGVSWKPYIIAQVIVFVGGILVHNIRSSQSED